MDESNVESEKKKAIEELTPIQNTQDIIDPNFNPNLKLFDNSAFDDKLVNSEVFDMMPESPIETDEAYPCDDCERSFVSHAQLNRHMLSHVQSNDFSEDYSPFGVPATSSSKRYSCNECEKTFSRIDILNRHKDSVHKLKTVSKLKCNICERIFSRKDKLQAHVKNQHKYEQRKNANEEKKIKKCDVCNKEFSRHQHLIRHKLTHSNIKEFSCSLCTSKFTRKDKLNQHLSKVHIKVCVEDISGKISYT